MELSRIRSKTAYKYGSRDLSPQSRFKTLDETAGQIPINPYEKAENYVATGESMFTSAMRHYQSDGLLDAFILFTRFLSMFEKRFHQHPGYKSLNESAKVKLNHYCGEAQGKLAQLRIKLLLMFTQDAEDLKDEDRLKARTHGSFIESEMFAELKTYMPIRRRISQLIRFDSWLQDIFHQADKNNTGVLEESEIQGLLLRLNLQSLAKDATRLFHDYKQPSTVAHPGGVVGQKEFIFLLFHLIKFPSVEKIFKKYADSEGHMNADRLLEFIQKEQGSEFTSMKLEDAQKLIKLNEIESIDIKMFQSPQKMTIHGFANLLMSPTFDIFMESHRQVYQDMTRPLCDYFIASSHNTYLTGNQLTGKSDVDAYAIALRKGCRCVELDCWDGGKKFDDEPLVYHGGTLTSKLLFRDVLEFGIAPHAFETSEYPVILSLENHCQEVGQLKMAEHLKDILGDALFTVSFDLSKMEKLPSPESLKRKFIVKASKKIIKLPTLSNELAQSLQTMVLSDKVIASVNANLSNLKGKDDENDIDYESDEENNAWVSDGMAESETPLGDSNEKVPKPLATDNPELSRWINICQAVKFQSFAQSESDNKPYHMSSFTESKAKRLSDQFPVDFVKYNRRQLSRIYPGGKRINSSNLDPLIFWKFGCQIVALNYQNEDDKTLLNKFFFADNGKCGYILKPKLLTDPQSTFNPKIDSNPAPAQVLHLKIEILGGFLLPQSRDESPAVPYVQIQVKGFDHDRDTFVTPSATGPNGGFNPVWFELSTCHFQIQSPDFALILFTVFDKAKSGLPGFSSDSEIGYYGIPVPAISSGYRAIHLVDKSGKYLTPATLIVRIHQNFGPPEAQKIPIDVNLKPGIKNKK